MKSQMPEKRPGDNVRLAVNYPQEDEFAMSNMNPYTYYQFMYLPETYKLFYRRFIRFEGMENIKQKWIADYQKMIEEACNNTGGQIPMLKNPCNTGRIPLLLDAYPDAKFIHIVRNPITIFLSARKFFTELLPTLWFHEVDEKFIENMVLDVYEMLIRDFLEVKSQIPEKNLIEFKFEDFERNPMYYLEKIYNQFSIPNYTKTKIYFEDYIRKMSNYRKNKYEVIPEDLMFRIQEKWGFAMDLWHYDLPEYLDVIKKEAVPDK